MRNLTVGRILLAALPLASCDALEPRRLDLPDPALLEAGRFEMTVRGEANAGHSGTAWWRPMLITEGFHEVKLRAETDEASWLAPAVSFWPAAAVTGGPVFSFSPGTHRMGPNRRVLGFFRYYPPGDHAQVQNYVARDGTLRIDSSDSGEVSGAFEFTAVRMGTYGGVAGEVVVRGAFRTLPAD